MKFFFFWLAWATIEKNAEPTTLAFDVLLLNECILLKGAIHKSDGFLKITFYQPLWADFVGNRTFQVCYEPGKPQHNTPPGLSAAAFTLSTASFFCFFEFPRAAMRVLVALFWLSRFLGIEELWKRPTPTS